jgi:hypothetical protein
MIIKEILKMFRFKTAKELERDCEIIFVNYIDKNLSLYKIYTHIATDLDGRVYGYTSEPFVHDTAPTIFTMKHQGVGYDNLEKFVFLGFFPYTGDWTQSKRSIQDCRVI